MPRPILARLNNSLRNDCDLTRFDTIRQDPIRFDPIQRDPIRSDTIWSIALDNIYIAQLKKKITPGSRAI